MKLFERLRRRLFAFQIFLLLVGSCVVAYGALRSFENDLSPEMTRKGDVIARSLTGQMERALGYGVAFGRIRGVEELFQSIRSSSPEIVFIAAVDHQNQHAFYSGSAERGTVLRLLAQQVPSSSDRVQPEAVRSGDFLVMSRPIIDNGGRAGWVHVGVDAGYIQQKLSEVFYDILVVLVVSLLLTFELLLLIMANASAPMQALQAMFGRLAGRDFIAPSERRHWPRELQRLAAGLEDVLDRLNVRYATLANAVSVADPGDNGRSRLDAVAVALKDITRPTAGDAAPVVGHSRLIAVRMPLFVFFFAEELSRSFFPIYVRSLYEPILGLSPEMVVSLPMVLFMLVVAFSQPLAGPWAQRLGARRLMIAGAVLGAGGLLLTAFAHSFSELLLWRFITGIGYGLVFVAGQSYVVTNVDASKRAWGLAMFVGSVLAASICGPAIGGILADRIGDRGTFMVGAGMALLSAGLCARLLQAPSAAGVQNVRPLRWRDVREVLGNARFVCLIALGAMPAKIILTGFLFYLAPLYLSELGNNPAAIGRMMMLYGLVMVLVTPLAARLVDRYGRRILFVVGGGVISGSGLLALAWSADTGMMIGAILLLGFAQALSITPQLALVPVACPDECQHMGQVTVIGFFRLFERIGSALGPVIAAALLHRLGYVPTMLAIGSGMCVGSLLLGLFWYRHDRGVAVAA